MTHSARTARTRTVCHEFLCTRFRSRFLKFVYVAYVPSSSSVFRCRCRPLRYFDVWSRPSSSSVSGDGFWKRAVSALPVALADGLRTAELDDPTVLTSYPRMDLEEAVLGLRALSCTTADSMVPAPSGVASSSHSSMSAGDLRAGIALCSSSWSAASAASGSGDVGGDPRTDHEALVSDRGGDPITDHASFVHVSERYGRYLSSLSAGAAHNRNCEFLGLCFLCCACIC